MRIDFGGKDFLLDSSGLLYWPEKRMAIVSDLHLEKGSHYGLRGFFLPPYDTRETLDRLHAALARTDVNRILLLGDCFHDLSGARRMGDVEKALFESLIRYECIWIEGNHDAGYAPSGVIAQKSWHEDGIVFRHEAEVGEEYEISGHYHPKITIHHKGGKVSRPCFVQGERKLILPSFGAYTGGLDVFDAAISKHMGNRVVFHALGKDRIFSLPSVEIEDAEKIPVTDS